MRVHKTTTHLGRSLTILLLGFATLLAAAPVRVVGYSEAWREGFGSKFNRFDEITHFLYAFIDQENNNVKFLDGDLQDLARVRDQAHAAGAKVLISFGGATGKNVHGTDPEIFGPKLAQLVIDNGIDGVDLDWEGLSTSDTPKLLRLTQILREKLPREQGYELSAAVFGSDWNGRYLNDATIALLDFINVMAYDEWYNGSNNHSSMEWAQATLDYWGGNRRVPKDKIVLGLPFYGYSGQWQNYKVYKDVNITTKDVDTDGTTQLNGWNTIQRKCDLVLNGGYGGVMIWSLQSDKDKSTGLSLLSAINEKIKVSNDDYSSITTVSSEAEGSSSATAIDLYHSSASMVVSRADRRGMELVIAPGAHAELQLIDAMGKVSETYKLRGAEGVQQIEWSQPLQQGIWFARLRSATQQYVVKLSR